MAGSRSSAALVSAAICLGLSVPAHAEDPLARARAAERAGDAEGELRACRELVRDEPQSRGGRACARRLDWLELRRSPDGSFRHLDALQAVRRENRELEPEDARARVDAVWRDGATPALVRIEAGLWLARQSLVLLQAPEQALEVSTVLWGEARQPGFPDAALARQVADLHARGLAHAGRLEEAEAVEAESQPLRSVTPREGLPLVKAQLRRARWTRLSLGLLAAWCGLAVPVGIIGWRRSPRPSLQGAATLLLTTGAAAAVGIGWDAAVAPLFGALGTGLLAVHLASLGVAQVARERGGLWPVGAGLCALLASLAWCWVVLDHGDRAGWWML